MPMTMTMTFNSATNAENLTVQMGELKCCFLLTLAGMHCISEVYH